MIVHYNNFKNEYALVIRDLNILNLSKTFSKQKIKWDKYVMVFRYGSTSKTWYEKLR